MSEKKEENDGKNSTSTASPQENRICSPQGRYVRLDERLGSGAYKDVWRAYDTIEGIEVAWNVIKLSRVPPNERKRIKTEVKLLKDLEHPNVIKYHNSWVNREREEIVFVTEIMSSGSLKDYIKKNPIIRWNAVKTWCQQILTGLKFLHSQQIIHRDIKCDNIFINGSTGDIRIGDLGLSTKIAEGNVLPPGTTDRGEIRQITAAAMTCLGTPEFMAPELYDESYNEKVDIYAFGMACLEMVTGLTPYHDCTSAAQIYKKVINGELPPELSLVRLSSAKNFIEACLQPENRRPSAEELLTYVFLSPNEVDDFLEVRGRLETVVEQSNSLSEDEDDNSDEEPPTSGIQRDHMIQYSERMTADDKNLMHSEPSRGFTRRLESRSDPKLHSPEGEKHPPVSVVRAKSLPTLDDNLGELVSAPLSDPQKSSVSTVAQVESNEGPPHVDEISVLTTPPPQTTSQFPVDESASNTHTVRRRLSGNATNSSEYRITTSRVLRVSEGARPRSSSWIDVTLSPILSEVSDSLTNSEAMPFRQTEPHHVFHEVNSADNAHHTLARSPPEENFLGVVDVDDKGSHENGVPGENCLIFRLRVPLQSTFKEIEFEFDLLRDNPQAIVYEMNEVDELIFLAPYAKQIVDSLTPIIEVARRVLEEKKQELTGKHEPALSNLVLEKLLATPGEFNDRALAAWSTAAEERKVKENEILAHSSIRSNQPIEVNLAAEIKRSPPSTARSDELSRVDVPEDNASKFPKPPSRNSSSGLELEKSPTQTPSHPHNKSAHSSPIKVSPEIDGLSGVHEGSSIRDHVVSKIFEDNTQNILDENDPEYQVLYSKFQEAIAKIEKDYHHVKSNIASQREKTTENYRREYEKAKVRQSDLNKQLENMEERFKERMSDFSQRKQQLYAEYLNKYPRSTLAPPPSVS